jgi:hypothetical protein
LRRHDLIGAIDPAPASGDVRYCAVVGREADIRWYWRDRAFGSRRLFNEGHES